MGGRHTTRISEEDIAALRASGLFDEQWYLNQYTDVKLLGMDPAEHYLWIGARLSRNPSSTFNGRAYLLANGDVAARGTNPLLHYMKWGKTEGRSWHGWKDPSLSTSALRSRPLLDLAQQLEEKISALPVPRQRPDTPCVDVIVPVYRGKDETLSCLWHVLKSKNRTAYELIVIDDNSPEPGLSEALGRIASAGYLRLVTNEVNCGFVKSANRGMRLHEDRDVILLNSDTEVYGDWIDRLRAVAVGNPSCGTVTPLTNNGTICSYPFFAKENDGLLELSFEELDRIASEVNRAKVVAAPTAVGFCMYVKREAIRHVGYFDEEAFGNGYGEENDFCLRSQKAGWTDLIASDTFVRHLGSVSFQAAKAERVTKNLRIIGQRYPSYHEDVRNYIKTDPIRSLRASLDLARLKRLSRQHNILIISHTKGGGTEQCVNDSIQRLSSATTAVFRMQVDDPVRQRAIHFHPRAPDVPNLSPLDLINDVDAIIALWNELGVTEVHLHHLIDFGEKAAVKMHALLQRAGRPFFVYLHDYLFICPRINLVGDDGVYCGEPNDSGCRSCLRKRGSQFGSPDIATWRSEHGQLLAAADGIIVPNEDVSERMQRYFPHLRFEVAPHEPSLPIRAKIVRRVRPRARIGTIGGISEIKGFSVLTACAREARRSKLPLDYIVVGHTKDDGTALAAGIQVTGRYDNTNLLSIINSADLDAIFLASTLPETYSYTLSAALKTSLPIIVFQIGAPARRIRGIPGSIILPLELARAPALLNSTILKALHE